MGIVSAAATVDPAPNGSELQLGYQDWRLVASFHRSENRFPRVIEGNDIAVNAARSGATNPRPNNTILGKLVWKDGQDAHRPAATVSGKFVHAEFI